MKKTTNKIIRTGAILIALCFLCIPLKTDIVFACSGTPVYDAHGNQTGCITGGGTTGKYNQGYNDENRQGIRITMYAYKQGSNNPVRVSNSVDFIWNNTGGANYTPASGVRQSKTSSGNDKLSYLRNGTSPQFSSGVSYQRMSYTKLIGNGGNPAAFQSEFITRYIGNGNSPILAKDAAWLNGVLRFEENLLKNGGYDGYYYLVEPLFEWYFRTGCSRTGTQQLYWATPYELAWLRANTFKNCSDSDSWIQNRLPNVAKVTTAGGMDTDRLIGDYIQTVDTAASTVSFAHIMSTRGWGMGLYWKKYAFYCKELPQFFPINKFTGEVSKVTIFGPGDNDVREDPNGAVDCCSQVLHDPQFGYNGDTTRFYAMYPQCLKGCNPKVFEKNPSMCGDTGRYYDDVSEDCMRAGSGGDNSQFRKHTILENYAYVVCKEDLEVFFPQGLTHAQSVGTYMVWPTAKSLGIDRSYSFTATGRMFCYLSINAGFIENSGRATSIYNSILTHLRSPNFSSTAQGWYNMNDKNAASATRMTLNLSYNDDEYGGPRVELVKENTTKNVIYNIHPNNLQPNYTSLNRFMITIETIENYRLEDNTYKKLTNSPGSGRLFNMFDNINKNQYVNNNNNSATNALINYPILPISFSASPLRNITNIRARGANESNAYSLTIFFRNFGDKGRFVQGETPYTCNYEVTFAPPKETGEDPGTDNNRTDDVTTCSCNPILPDGTSCPANTLHMDLTGYLAKNPGMTCNQAQLTYCPTQRGNMNVEYRVIDLRNPFPGITGLTYPASRRIGSNWRESINQYNVIDNTNSMVNRYIRNNRGVRDYEVYSHPNGPLYVIELDNAAIHAIRAYNKANDYSNFDMNCMDSQIAGRKCTSNFLRNNGLLQSGSCAGTLTESNFNSCADKLETTPRGPLDLRGVHR